MLSSRCSAKRVAPVGEAAQLACSLEGASAPGSVVTAEVAPWGGGCVAGKCAGVAGDWGE